MGQREKSNPVSLPFLSAGSVPTLNQMLAQRSEDGHTAPSDFIHWTELITCSENHSTALIEET
jgi:hypothetical protein